MSQISKFGSTSIIGASYFYYSIHYHNDVEDGSATVITNENSKDQEQMNTNKQGANDVTGSQQDWSLQ